MARLKSFKLKFMSVSNSKQKMVNLHNIFTLGENSCKTSVTCTGTPLFENLAENSIRLVSLPSNSLGEFVQYLANLYSLVCASLPDLMSSPSNSPGKFAQYLANLYRLV